MITRTSRGTKRFMATAAAVAMIGSTLAISSAASAGPGVNAPASVRLSGADRYATAVDVADEIFVGNQGITIVNGESFADGLASAHLFDVILLTEADSIPAATAEWLNTKCEDGDINYINVVGGVDAVSSAVFEELLECGVIVERIAGANRYSTAIAVAEYMGNAGAIILATGENFPDALAAGPLSQEEGAPIILNNGDSLRADVAAYLDANPNITGVYIVGGETVISAEIEAELAGPRGMNVTRLAGATRADTAVAIAEELHANNPTDAVVLVNASGFADALSASILAYDFNNTAPILLVNADSIPAATAAWHTTNCNTIEDVWVVGGTSVVSASVLADAVAAATCAPVGITSAALTVSDVKQRVLSVSDVAGPDGLVGNTDDDADNGTAIQGRLTAVAGGAADAASGNAWTVSMANGASAGAVVNATAKTIVYTDAFSAGLTQAGFVSNFNASAAGAIFTASAATNGTGTYVTTPDVAQVSAGSSDYTVVVTFNQNVDNGAGAAPATPRLSSNQSTAINAYVDTVGATATAPAAYTAAGSASVTYLFDDETAVLSLSTGSIKFAATSVTGAVTNVANTAILVGAL